MGELASKLKIPFFDTTDYFMSILDDIKLHPENYDLSKNKCNENLIKEKVFHELFSEQDYKIHISGYFFSDIIHPNGFGHEHIGRELTRKLLNEWDLIKRSN